jgi:MSHA biogenesis protein MshM
VYAGAALAAGVLIGAAVHWAFFARSVKPEVPVAQLPPVPPVQAQFPAIPPAQAAPAPVAVTREPDLPPPPAPLLTPDQVRRFSGYSPAGQRLLAERIAATHELLGRVPDAQFAIELFTTDNTDPARMERFLVRARDLVPLGELFVIPMARGEQYRLRVIFGEFPSRTAAIEAGKRLPPRYQQAFRTSPRSFAELRGQI